MGFRSIAKRLTTSVAELDAEELRSFCAERVCTKVSEITPKSRVTVIGEISSLRIVPRNGSPWLEATVSDGSGSMVVMWTGRREIAGVTPGKRLSVTGLAMPLRTGGTKMKLMNPAYELLVKSHH